MLSVPRYHRGTAQTGSFIIYFRTVKSGRFSSGQLDQVLVQNYKVISIFINIIKTKWQPHNIIQGLPCDYYNNMVVYGFTDLIFLFYFYTA